MSHLSPRTPDSHVDIANVVHRFFYALDTRSHQDAAALMHPEGQWHRQGAVLEGRQAVFDALEARPASRTTCHQVTNLRTAALSEHRMEAHFYLLTYESTALEPLRLVSVRDCRDLLLKVDGQWLIEEKSSRQHLPAA